MLILSANFSTTFISFEITNKAHKKKEFKYQKIGLKMYHLLKLHTIV
jgi:hypothetical protein